VADIRYVYTKILSALLVSLSRAKGTAHRNLSQFIRGPASSPLNCPSQVQYTHTRARGVAMKFTEWFYCVT